MKKKIILSWIIVIVLIVIIFCFSNQQGTDSSALSSGIAERIYTFLGFDKDIGFIYFHKVIRKMAHFTLYFALGLSLFNAFHISCYREKRVASSILVPILLCVISLALFDEIHQLFINGRSAELFDSVIDSSGGSVGVLVYYLVFRIKNR